MVQTISEGTRKSRKPHPCFHCYRDIPKGETYRFFTGNYDGIYTLKMHLDCHDAANFYISETSYEPFDGGFPPLWDMISEDGEVEADFAMIRGHFPHVVCRMNFGRRDAE